MVDQPTWSKKWLDQEAIDRIEQAIQDVETKTNAEIVPMLVHSSSTVGHTPWLLSAYVFILYLILDAVFDFRRFTDLYSVWLTIGFLAIFLLSYSLAKLDVFQRLTVTADDRDRQVNQRAEIEFYEAGLEKTTGRTGILLLVSLMEHRAVVIADRSIAEKVQSETWASVVNTLVSGAKNGSLGPAYEKAIHECGEIVYPHFPKTEENKNELFDHLVIKS